jgi:hypothetical protein
MLNEVILACKTYDIMRYYHVKEMSLSYDCVLVVSLNRVSPVSRPKYFVCPTFETRMKKGLYAERSNTKFEYSLHNYESECGIYTFMTTIFPGIVSALLFTVTIGHST